MYSHSWIGYISLKSSKNGKNFLYSRVSTDDQDYQSQFGDLRKWAKANNYKVDKVFGEKVSGFDLTKERAEYDSMKKYVIEKNIKNIAVLEISRLSRSTAKTLSEIEFFTQNQINIFLRNKISTLFLITQQIN